MATTKLNPAKGEDAYSDALRKRLADIRASGGVPHSQVALEVLFMMPADFLRQYGALFQSALRSDGGEGSRGRQQQENAAVGKHSLLGKTGKGPTVQGAPKKHKGAFVVLDERMLQLKTRMDKRLRNLAREIHEDMVEILDGSTPMTNSKRHFGGIQCLQCKCFLDAGWKFCPQCGRNQSLAA